MKDTPKSKSHKCPFCTPENAADQCILATAKTVIDGKEYSACCSNREEKSVEEKGHKTDRKTTKR
jgi:hypothetical protein